MAEPKWTKGPWVLDTSGCIAADDGTKWPTKYIKCTSPWIEGAHRGDAEMMANQQLMAAAPELYGALEWFSLLSPEGFDHEGRAALVRALDALAKARGDD
jgi:hypothetical protein